MKISIVATTINDPKRLLDAYSEYLIQGRNKIYFIIVGDHKTPVTNIKQTDYDFYVEYWTPKQQDEHLQKNYGNLYRDLIPENSPRRRNFGYLRALELKSDYTVVIDDDNLPLNYNWVSEHIEPMETQTTTAISSKNKYVNPCEILKLWYPEKQYMRGYPISSIFSDTFDYALVGGYLPKSVMNCGLWIDKPDLDAYTNIIFPKAESLYAKRHGSWYLSYDNYAPINTQNTCFSKKVAPIFWNIYAESVYGLPFNRYDDIWNGLFITKLAHHFDDTVSFGQPIVRHTRNVHDYTKDLATEFIGIVTNQKIWDHVRKVELHSKNYIDGYKELANSIVNADLFKDNEVRMFIRNMCDKMHKWINLSCSVK